MTTIRVKENEPFDVALRRFKRTIEKIGLLPPWFWRWIMAAIRTVPERLFVRLKL